MATDKPSSKKTAAVPRKKETVRISLRARLDDETTIIETNNPELERLIVNSQQKRALLESLAAENSRKRANLTIIGGSLSICAALTFASPLSNVLPEELLEFVALLVAAGGGLIAIFSSFRYRDTEIIQIHKGASAFLDLREQLIELSTAEKKDPKIIRGFRSRYVELSELYDIFLRFESHEEIEAFYVTREENAEDKTANNSLTNSNKVVPRKDDTLPIKGSTSPASAPRPASTPITTETSKMAADEGEPVADGSSPNS